MLSEFIVEGTHHGQLSESLGIDLRNTPRFQRVQSTYAGPFVALANSPHQSAPIVPLGSDAVLMPGRPSTLEANDSTLRVIANSAVDLRLPQMGPSGAAVLQLGQSWGLSTWDIERLKALSLDGRGIKVGIVDSGIDLSHPAFRNLVNRGGLRALAGFAEDGTFGGVASDIQAPSSVPFRTYSHWHGTHCASILAGDGDDAGKGVAPGVDLYVAKVLDDSNRATVASIYAGLEWLRQFECDVVSASIGWHGYRDQWAKPVLGLLESGTVVVAASGNEFGLAGFGQTRSPANYVYSTSLPGRLVSVGAIQESGAVWERSGGEDVVWPSTYDDSVELPRLCYFAGMRWTVPDVVGPGVDIPAAMPNGGYGVSSGTSMAAPFISGLVALVLQRLRASDPSTQARVAADALLRCAVDIPPSGKDIRYGLGIPSPTALYNQLFG